MIRLIWDAFSERVGNPWVGSIFLSVLAINWNAFLYLFISQEGVLDKIEYFEQNTTRSSLVFIPIGVGIAVSVLMPWFSFFHIQMSEFPHARARAIFRKRSEVDLDRKINLERRKQAFVLAIKERSELENKILNPEVRAEIDESLRKPQPEKQEENQSLLNVNAYFSKNNLPSKTQKDILWGTAKYLTENKGRFTKDELFGVFSSHNSWEINFNKNRANNFKRLFDNGRILDLGSGQYKADLE